MFFVFSMRFSSHVSRIARDFFFLKKKSEAADKIRSVLLPRCRSTLGLAPCRAVQSPVFANVCRRLASSAAAAASRSTLMRSIGQRSR